jgi:hypothetical protein
MRGVGTEESWLSPMSIGLSGGILSCCKGDYQVGGGSGVRKRSGARRFGGDHLDASETGRRSKVNKLRYIMIHKTVYLAGDPKRIGWGSLC